MIAIALDEGMSSQTLTHAASDGVTERVDAVASLDQRVLSRASETLPDDPGRYLEVQGAERTLVLPLSDDPIHIGRGPSADLRLDESSVSRRHAILLSRPTGARILDESSSNGTFVNGRRVQQADLSDGDVIVIGRVVLRYIEVGSSSSR
jgi:pSer/pThr/pTyr-binding forkhead associated (FHA) protein